MVHWLDRAKVLRSLIQEAARVCYLITSASWSCTFRTPAGLHEFSLPTATRLGRFKADIKPAAKPPALAC